MAKAFLANMSAGRYLLPLSAVAEMLASLLRAVVLARILPPDQFGVAVALALVLSLAETAADLGLDRQVVRLKLDGDLAAQRGTLHSLALGKGAILALLLLALAWPLAALFDARDAAPAFAALAICPLLKGAAHLGVKELARDYRFGPDALAIIVLHGVTLATAIIMGVTVGQAWVVSAALITGYAAYMLMTHLLAPTPWRLDWNRPTAREALRYGAPLLPNGIAQGLKNIGDRLIVGALLGPASLSLYSVAAMIGIMPRGIILRYLTTLFLPRFVNASADGQAAPLTAAFAILLGCVASVLGLGLWCFGKPVVGLVFGAAYEPTQALMAAIAVMVALKLLVATVTLPALAFGATSLILYGSAGSLAGIALGGVTLWFRPDLVLFTYAVALCDAIALVSALLIGGSRLGLRTSPVLIPTLAPIALLVGLGLASSGDTLGVWTRMAVSTGLAAALTAGAAALLTRAGMPPRTLLATLRASPPGRSARTPDAEPLL